MNFNIENYESMSNEEKLAALEAAMPDMSQFVAKSVFDKKASEAADLGKQLKARMSEDELRAAKEAEDKAAAAKREEELLARVQELENERKRDGYVASYLTMGYDEKLAKSSADALVKGDMDTVFKNQKIHAENQEKAFKAELLKQTPPPASGNGEGTIDKGAFSKMSLLEKQKFASENPELYASFYENKEE